MAVSNSESVEEVSGEEPNLSWMLIPIVAASGFAGLGYEMVWTRLLSLPSSQL
jgi:hypothetical protein